MLLKEIESFLEEDVGYEDYEEIVPYTTCKAEITVKEEGILAGLDEAKQIFDYLSVQYSTEFEDGARIDSGDTILIIRGAGAKILKAERLVLNFLGRMSGIATVANKFVNEARKVNEHIRVAGTRKTTPGFRKYEKKAIAIGGGDPHRFGLYEAVIIKDNSIKLMGLESAIKKAKEKASFTKKIEVEVESKEDALIAAVSGVDIIMLDNMTAAEVKECVKLLNERGLRDSLILEASGGINMENIKEFASTGVDVVSIGMITHSAKWLGFSMNVVE
ncbi:MAG: carboxylating nicotinate-nucleotide diphosphorylase [Methanophagales archaeon]|nr:carboxylating nicotinate-nucleotide diphosphorylase [Methanophagales archaeon]MCW3141242.1 carboxylating nicotinate-nucleotide diphosphorylase [Methanophagales archaeon]